MAYVHLDLSKPDWAVSTGEELAEDIRQNLAAIRDMVTTGAMIGWNYSKSGGTSMQPATYLYSKGTERLKVDVTWGSSGGSTGSITQSIYSYSSNSGSTYDVFGTKTIAYDADGVVTTTTWS